MLFWGRKKFSNSDNKQVWPELVSPYDVVILPYRHDNVAMFRLVFLQVNPNQINLMIMMSLSRLCEGVCTLNSDVSAVPKKNC